MKHLYLLFVLWCACMSVTQAQESTNPFIKMAGRPYADYFDELDKIAYLDRGDSLDSLWVVQVAGQMREAAKISKNKKWLLEADYFEATSRFVLHIRLNKPNQEQMDSLVAVQNNELRQIIQRAKKTKAVDIELRAMFSVWCGYMWYMKNYEMGFRYTLEMDKALSTVTVEEFPFKPYFYSCLGDLYHDFQEYEKAKALYEKSAENNPTIIYEKLVLRRLWNNLGLIYRYHFNDLDKSDSCFRKILETAPQLPEQPSPTGNRNVGFTLQDEYELWVAIAKGNLGTNAYLRGDYDAAVPLLEYGMEKATENNPYNYPYAVSKALTLSDIFLLTSDLPRTKQYADRAFEFLDLDRNRDKTTVEANSEMWTWYYRAMSNYCRMSGDPVGALSYTDSADVMRIQFEEEYNLRKLHREEQRARQEKLDAEILRSKIYYRNMVVISAFTLLLLVLSVLLYRLYRQKSAFCQALILKTQQWAETETPLVQLPYKQDKKDTGIKANSDDRTEKEKTEPDEIDRQLFNNLNKLIIDKQLHLTPETTLDHVAQVMKIRRSYLSQAVNRCTGGNFTSFINEYRVKEAVRLMSNTHLSIKEIAYKAGFNDRISFYRVFKKLTGFSPDAFRNRVSSVRE